MLRQVENTVRIRPQFAESGLGGGLVSCCGGGRGDSCDGNCLQKAAAIEHKRLLFRVVFRMSGEASLPVLAARYIRKVHSFI